MSVLHILVIHVIFRAIQHMINVMLLLLIYCHFRFFSSDYQSHEQIFPGDTQRSELCRFSIFQPRVSLHEYW